MPWSKAVLKKSESQAEVLEYNPVTFVLGTPSAAMDYMEAKKQGSDFRLSDVVRKQTGVEEIELQNEVRRVEDLAMEKLKEIQENAYKEGFSLGFEDGRKRAFDENSKVIAQSISELNSLLKTIENMKKEILSHNEAHIMQLLFHMASKLAQAHLEYDHEPLINIIKQAIELAQGDENVTVYVSKSQLEFLESVQQQQNAEMDALNKVKLIANDSIKPGGCIVETNYGEVDSQVETRVEQLLVSLKEHMPRVKPKIVG